MNIILLSGGSGKRLWPLSNETRSKQFLRLLKNESGEKESMVQRVYRQIGEAGIRANIIIATGKTQIDPIRSQLGDAVDVVTEPARRDTFPAIALACAHLAYNRGLLEKAGLPTTEENIFIVAACGEKGLKYLQGERLQD